MKSKIVFIAIIALCLVACVDENFTNDYKYQVRLSCDTVFFDTLLIEQHSATYKLMIYNDNKYAIKLKDMYIDGGENSFYHFNVDGMIPSKNKIEDITLRAKDSIFVFIEVTAPKEIDNNTLILEDSLIVQYNSHWLSIPLYTPTLNAHILYNQAVEGIWDNDKPYLVIGNLHVPENKKLTVNEGVTIYMHSKANIVVDGEIELIGSAEKPITIRGDRYDKINDTYQTPYDFMPGQWGGIYLQNPEGQYLIRHTNIRGMETGVLLIGSARSYPSLLIENSTIHNSTLYGLYSQQGNMTLINCEISNCAQACLIMIGGEMAMIHSTLANYYTYATRKTASLQIVNAIKQYGVLYTYPIERAVIENSIIFGSIAEEVELKQDSVQHTDFNLLFSNCLIKGKKQNSPYFNNCRWAKSRNIKNASDTVFVRTTIAHTADTTKYYDFRLSKKSYARHAASAQVAAKYPLDKEGNSRLDDGEIPDIGAYEYIKKEE